VARRLVEMGYEAIGLDFSPVQLINLARCQVPRVRVVQADMMVLPSEPNGSMRSSATTP
jgi:hypothetical protein